MEPKQRVLIWMAVACGLLFLYGAGLLRWAELTAQKSVLEAEVARLKQENIRLYEEARRLREDPAYAEAVARRELGFVRPGETKIKFKDASSTKKQ